MAILKNYFIQLAVKDRRDAQAAGQGWSQADLDKMKQLSDIGIQLSVTGGIDPQSIYLFKDINVKAFIAGRAIAGAPDPFKVCQEFKTEFKKYFN